MGNTPSLYEETDWTKADGGLSSAAETVDGAEPVPSHTTVTLAPQGVTLPGRQVPVVGNLVTVREYQVWDSDGSVVYMTKKVDGLRRGFDLLDKDEKTVLLRVNCSYNNRTWHILQVNRPVFEGQRPFPLEEPKYESILPLYRKACVQFGKDVEHAAEVYMFRDSEKDDDDDDNDVDTVLKVERCSSGSKIVPGKWHFQSMLPQKSSDDEQQLVGYWKWEGSNVPLSMDEKIVLDVTKGSDLGLHVILAVMATLERSSIKAEYTG